MSIGLFEPTGGEGMPLAARMRPRSLAEYVGQARLLAEGLPLRTAIEAGTLGSVVMWAPPGCGKTTLARIVAESCGAAFEARSAVTCGVAEIRKLGEAARERLGMTGQRTVLLLDEIHHFNRSQQDSLLGYLEDGVLTLVGATTENPYVALNGALLSRVRVLPMKPLGAEDCEQIVRRALEDTERGLGSRGHSISGDALHHLVRAAGGDARVLLTSLEAAASAARSGEEIGIEEVELALTARVVRYDRQGDQHYDTISAFIKSVRGSDADAALHYLARMIHAGEDPRFIARRLVILASEDIGNADPMGLVVATNALLATERIGMPEARIVLGQATCYLAEAPKSNRAYLAIERALEDAEKGALPPIPLHLRNAPNEELRNLGHGAGYLYPHDDERGWVDQAYLPEGDLATPYYEPSDRGHEAKMRSRRKARD
ncbi:MAG: replication-associated recombination protein A [Fimbriimonadaceae bacterium]|nr:replication-associated recombination protein A [Fimbriimonadaceae bacterium]